MGNDEQPAGRRPPEQQMACFASRSKYLWLKNPGNLTTDHKSRFWELRQSGLKVSRAWTIKDLVARMIRSHWDGVINAVTSNVTNAASEGMNSKIQRIKRKACGYRNRENFRNAIYFHCGGLDMYPKSVQITHMNS